MSEKPRPEVIELVRRTGSTDPAVETELFACAECGRLHSPLIYVAGGPARLDAARAQAEECCTPVKCDCGKTCEQKFHTACNQCIADREKAKFARKLAAAKRYTVGEAPRGPVMLDGDRFEPTVEDLLSTLSCDDRDREDFPLIAWLCDETTPQMDVGRVIEDFHARLEISSECDVEDVTTDLDKLCDAIEKWNKKQKPTLWVPAETAYVEIQYDDVYPDEDKQTKSA